MVLQDGEFVPARNRGERRIHFAEANLPNQIRVIELTRWAGGGAARGLLPSLLIVYYLSLIVYH
jgi:hypothetical protein